MSAFAIEIGFIFVLAFAAISDYQRLVIPNWISIALCGLFLAHSLKAYVWPEIAWHVAIGLGTFLCAFALYAFGIFGGGDVKLLGAIALWAGPEHIVEFAILTGLLGGVLGLLVLAARLVVRNLPEFAERTGATWNLARWGRDGVCPYGIAIAFAAVLVGPAIFAR